MSLTEAQTGETATPPASAAPPPARPGLMRRLYDWVLKWADTPYAVPMLFAISFAEASFFPVPPDVLLLPLCFALPKKSLRFATWCLLASVLGGMAGYGIGYGFWDVAHDWFIPHLFSQAAFDRVKATYLDNAFMIIVAKGFTPIPFKIVTITAGVAHVPFATFVAASVICRSMRFYLLGTLIYFFGPAVRPFVEKYLGWLLMGTLVLLVGGFVALKMLH
jgi:membrane protein YqaA with SNARE-associated domain